MNTTEIKIKDKLDVASLGGAHLIKVENEYVSIEREKIGVFCKRNGWSIKHGTFEFCKPNILNYENVDLQIPDYIVNGVKPLKVKWKHVYEGEQFKLTFFYDEALYIKSKKFRHWEDSDNGLSSRWKLLNQVDYIWEKCRRNVRVYKGLEKIADISLLRRPEGIIRINKWDKWYIEDRKRNRRVYRAIRGIVGKGVHTLPEIRRKIGPRGSDNYQNILKMDGRGCNVFDHYRARDRGYCGWEEFCSYVGISILRDGRYLYYVIK